MMTAMLAVKNIQGAQYDCWKVNSDAEYHEGEVQTKTFKVVFRLKKDAAPQSEDVTARDENEARGLVQTKYGLATYLIVSVAEIKG